MKSFISFVLIIISFFSFSAVYAEEYYSDEYREQLFELYDCLDKQITEYETTEQERVQLNIGDIKVACRGYEVDGAVSWNDARKIVAMLCGKHPRFLSTVNNIGYYYDKQTPELITLIDLKRLAINGSYEETYNVLNAEADKILDEIIRDNMSDLDKAFAVYMYLISNYNHESAADSNNREPDTIYGILINKSGACGGFANTYKWLMDKLNIPCEICNSRSRGHIWNYVKIDDCWYHVDAIQGASSQTANFFLVDESERKTQLVTSDKIVYDWASINKNVVCDSNRFNDGSYLFDRVNVSDFQNIKYDNGYYFSIDKEMFYSPTLCVMNNLISLPRAETTGELADVKAMKSAYSIAYGDKRNFTAYIVAYNSGGNIINIEKRGLSFDSLNRQIDLSTDAAETADSIKIFFWADNSITPIANMIEIK